MYYVIDCIVLYSNCLLDIIIVWVTIKSRISITVVKEKNDVDSDT